MAKPNYSFEKRQRELAKKKKKEEKIKERQSKPGATYAPDGGGEDTAPSEVEPSTAGPATGNTPSQ